jgi:hypothetical protein
MHFHFSQQSKNQPVKGLEVNSNQPEIGIGRTSALRVKGHIAHSEVQQVGKGFVTYGSKYLLWWAEANSVILVMLYMQRGGGRAALWITAGTEVHRCLGSGG